MRWVRGFDGLRGIAAVLVVLTHLGVLVPLRGGPLGPMLYGATAVHLFFVEKACLLSFIEIGADKGIAAFDVVPQVGQGAFLKQFECLADCFGVFVFQHLKKE